MVGTIASPSRKKTLARLVLASLRSAASARAMVLEAAQKPGALSPSGPEPALPASIPGSAVVGLAAEGLPSPPDAGAALLEPKGVGLRAVTVI